jgi:hypothetical protein
MTEITDAAVRAALAEHARLLIDRPEPTVLPDETLFRRVLEAALPHMAPEAPDLTAATWRQGRRKGRNLYAVTEDDWEAHPAIGCLDTAELAEEACRAHNDSLARSHLAWLLDAGLEVRMIPDGPGMEVILSDPEGGIVDTVTTGAEASVGSTLMLARALAMQAGYAPGGKAS